MSTGFGQWYEEKKQEDGPEGGGGGVSSWFGNFQAPDMEGLPLFNTESMQNFSFANMKQAMEAQMPKKIMGMNYQQRFQVFGGLLLISALFFALAFFVGLPTIAMRPQKFALSFVSLYEPLFVKHVRASAEKENLVKWDYRRSFDGQGKPCK